MLYRWTDIPVITLQDDSLPCDDGKGDLKVIITLLLQGWYLLSRPEQCEDGSSSYGYRSPKDP
jgi:hypothetical protein